MAKRKKKPSQYSQQKIAAAHHRNEFAGKLRYFCSITLGENAFNLIPASELEEIIKNRLHSVNVLAADDHQISNAIIDDIKFLLSRTMLEEKVSIREEWPELLYKDCFSVGLTLLNYLEELKPDAYPAAAELKRLYQQTINFKELHDVCFRRLHSVSITIGFVESNLTKEMYWCSYGFEVRKTIDPYIYNRLSVYKYIPEKANFVINGQPRPAVRLSVGFVVEGMKHREVMPEELGIQLAVKPGPMPVYIQSHALQRMAERIDGIDPGITQAMMYISFDSVKCSHDRSGKIFVEYRLFDIKCGYLLCDICNGSVVIRTFLFITNDGTPEAERLKALTGLERKDIEYLSIDKLSTFIFSDLSKNDRIRKILREAHCESLIELHDKLQHLKGPDKKLITAAEVIKYMKKDL